MNPTRILLASTILLAGLGGAVQAEDPTANLDYHRAKWDPIHLKPAIDKATDEQCLECHQEIIERRVLERSPAGIKAADALAWYQTLDTYQGAQDTFHRRHVTDDYAQQVMDLKCNTCHQGNDLREEVPQWPGMSDQDFTLRKMVNPDICLRCHGQFDYKLMNLAGPWPETGKLFGGTCLTCHASIRTNRHKVNFLKSEAIEQAALEDPDVCYGCHGGRAWYRIAYPFPRHAWEGMSEETPDWAKDRPTESEARFRVSTQGAETKTN
jgi:hypothetical protein